MPGRIIYPNTDRKKEVYVKQSPALPNEGRGLLYIFGLCVRLFLDFLFELYGNFE